MELNRRRFMGALGTGLLGASSGTFSQTEPYHSSSAASTDLRDLRWKKQGRCIQPEDAPEWRRTHSGMVSVLPWENDRYRLFLTGKKAEGFFQIGWLELSRALELVYENPDNPILTRGRMGTFDCRGICMPLVVRVSDSVLHLYYVGWGIPGLGLFQNDSGLAVSRDNGRTWSRHSEGGLIPRDQRDPLGTGTVFVMREEARHWRMWYTSFVRWEPANPERSLWHPFYLIKYAESEDGIHWQKPEDNIAIDLLPGEQCTARPMVIKEPSGYRMWFCHRQLGSTYRIGYAESAEGRHWIRKAIDLSPSDSGWDSEMIEYPYVLKESGRYLMFYNGNGFGRTGTGTALGLPV